MTIGEHLFGKNGLLPAETLSVGESGASGTLGSAAHASPAHPSYAVFAPNLNVGRAVCPWCKRETRTDIPHCDWCLKNFPETWSTEDSMAASIVRLEQENEELRAEVALLREERAIILRDATKQTLRVGAVKSHWIAAYQERDEWRECAERLIGYAHESLANLASWAAGYERYEREMEKIRADIAEFERLKENVGHHSRPDAPAVGS